MGLVYQDVRAMLAARQGGASFDRVITLGHQKLFLHDREIHALSREFGLPTDRARPAWAGAQFGDYSDVFFRKCLGTTELSFLDVSDYQGATLLHDLNRPVPREWHQRFDVVVDGGTLEHIFEVPQGLANVMRLACVGGRVFSMSPASNLCGHGFYQFSPELLFRAFAPNHGFRTVSVTLIPARYPGVTLTSMRRAYGVRDPADLGARIGLVSRRPVLVALEAVKVAHLDDPFAEPPQQSDYVQRWREKRAHGRSTMPRIANAVLRALPSPLEARLRGSWQLQRHSFRNRGAYTRLS